jgi:hypothetical protein
MTNPDTFINPVSQEDMLEHQVVVDYEDGNGDACVMVATPLFWGDEEDA